MNALTRIIKQSLIVSFLSLIGWVTSSSLASELPDLGDPSQSYFSAAQEAKLGKAFMNHIRASNRLIYDPITNQYIRELGDRLLNAAGVAHENFSFFVLNNHTVNAFAGPSGKIGVNSGLILMAKNESELAAVLAHEIAHVTQKHVARAVAKVKQDAIPTLAAVLGSIALSVASPQAGAGALSATLAGTQQNIINFTRHNETEADHVGINTLYNAHFNPNSMADVFLMLDKRMRLSTGEQSELLMTHPVTPHRIADANNRALNFEPKPIKESEDFPYIQERVRIITSANNHAILNYYRDNKHLTDPERYGYVLALVETHYIEEAKKQSAILLKKHPQNAFVAIAVAGMEIADAHPELAVLRLAALLKRYPQHYALNLKYGFALVEAKQYEQAIHVLRKLTVDHADDPILFQILAKAYSKSDQLAKAYQARSQIFILHDNTRGAIEQLELALKQKDIDRLTKAKIEAQIAKLKSA